MAPTHPQNIEFVSKGSRLTPLVTSKCRGLQNKQHFSILIPNYSINDYKDMVKNIEFEIEVFFEIGIVIIVCHICVILCCLEVGR